MDFPIKTGLGGQREMSDDEMLDIAGLVSAFSKYAVITAYQYVEHAGRKVVTVEDLKYALQNEVFQFSKRETILDDASEFRQMLVESMEDEEEEVEFEPEDLVGEEFSESTCECEFCKIVNNAHNIWDDWEPENPFEAMLKSRIDEITETSFEVLKEIEAENGY